MISAGRGPQTADGQSCGEVRRRVPLTHLDHISVDAAVIKPLPGIECGNQAECGRPNGIRDLWIADEALQPIAVQKHGAQTGMTSGVLLPVPADLFVPDQLARYNAGWWVYPNDGVPFAAQGDSGAMVLDANRYVVGMLVAVDKTDGTAFVHGIKQIFNALQVTL